jgi:hypothetical protein
MEGVDIVIYIPDGGLEHLATDSEALSDGKVYAKTAKELGVKRFVFVGSCQPGEKDNSGLEQELHELADDAFTITLLQLGDLYGHASATQWFGDLHDSAGRIKPFPTVNSLTARAIMNGRVSAVETGPRPFLHVEDAAASIIAVLDAPPSIVNGQIYNIGAEDQVRSVREIADLIKKQAPNAEFVIATEDKEGTTSTVILSRIHDELGFSPTRTLEGGIAQIITALEDGSVKQYMSVRTTDIEVLAVSESPTTPASEIQWQNLTYTSVEVEKSESSTDQSIQQH